MSLALLDLPAPLFTALDGALALLLPALARVWLYGAVSGWLCMALYRRLSAQSALQALASRTRELRRELAAYDGPFDGLLLRVRELLRLSGRHLRLSFVPALLAGLPVLFLLPWLSNQFSHTWPAVGSELELRPQGLTVPIEQLRWSKQDDAVAVRWDAQAERWLLRWPAADAPLQLQHDGQLLLRLPLPAPVPVVHRYSLPLNLLVANPAGYLPDQAPLQAVTLALPAQPLHPYGPAWLRHWLSMYLLSLLLVSLWLRWRWRLQ